VKPLYKQKATANKKLQRIDVQTWMPIRCADMVRQTHPVKKGRNRQICRAAMSEMAGRDFGGPGRGRAGIADNPE
jgi:hypothetical protein